MADPAAVSIVIPAFNEADVDRRGRRAISARRRRVARDHRRRRRLDGRHRRARGQPPARRVVRHPYNKGNGAAVKSGIRRATGEYILIVDGDGQHPARGRAAARVARSASTTSSSARDRRDAGDAGAARRQRALNWLASYLTGREIPDLTSGFRGAAPRVPARVPAPAAQRLLDADDDDAGVPQGGLQRDVRADSTRGSESASPRSGSRATARSS